MLLFTYDAEKVTGLFGLPKSNAGGSDGANKAQQSKDGPCGTQNKAVSKEKWTRVTKGSLD
eukprot:1596402-Pleurochrysis_carterae.AAC.2